MAKKPTRKAKRSLELRSLVKDVGEGKSLFGVFIGTDEFMSPATGEILPIVGLMPYDGEKISSDAVYYWLPAGLMTALKTAKVQNGEKIEIEVGKEIPHPKNPEHTIRQFAVYEAEF
jgi:hypothetical protein